MEFISLFGTPKREPTVFERCQAQIAQRWRDQGVDLAAAEAIQQAYLDALVHPPQPQRVR